MNKLTLPRDTYRGLSANPAGDVVIVTGMTNQKGVINE
jgi:hypothetical protein